ncbi:tumor necrosis factor receptor superfamily member 1A [Brachionichthys hirsutus]|uniref:tumor necrosis factor receptor superfamily member 1A n=1 Tax=Brachionichthys hirsutus TaxID=412623 RepID=UPI00360436DF
MDSLWVFQLVLVFLSNAQSYPEVASAVCHPSCPRGYYAAERCTTPAGKYRCEKCSNGETFTAVNNTVDKCRLCGHCRHYEVVKRPCTSQSEVVCECREGYYYDANALCRQCPSKTYGNEMENKNYQRCLENSSCRRTCRLTVLRSSISTTSTSVPTTGAATNMLNPVVDPVPAVNQTAWFCLSGALVIFLGLLWLLLFFNRKAITCPCCPCWSAKRHLQSPNEDPDFHVQCSQGGNDLTTLTFKMSEESLAMDVSQHPGTPEHPAYITHLLPVPEAARPDKQPERWPATVLYAIIKEVPLRRWKEFLRLLAVADQQLERFELEAGLGVGSMERQYQMLKFWSQSSSASMDAIFSALHSMDLSGCAQQLQDSLEKLHWRWEQQRGFTDHVFSGGIQDS